MILALCCNYSCFTIVLEFAYIFLLFYRDFSVIYHLALSSSKVLSGNRNRKICRNFESGTILAYGS